ncbi:MAG: DUF1156 domain-containing protein [Desulfurococcaceae archaeon]|jgi:putative DNA methylase
MKMERLIERWLPTEHLSQEAARERGARFPPLFWLHVWWARRPLIGMRTVIAASLVNANGVDEKRREEFLRAVWLLSPAAAKSSRKKSNRRGYEGQPERPAYNYNPLISIIEKLSGGNLREIRLLDVFAGGGSIPFEALRLGIGEVVAVEYNPVAYIILKATLEYPLKYGQRLARDVERWAKWLLERVKEEVRPYYPRHPKGAPTNYIWVRVYRCPLHNIEIPSIALEMLSKESPRGIKVEYGEGGFKIVIVEGRGERTYANGLRCPKGHVIPTKDLGKLHAAELAKWDNGDFGRHPAVMAAVKLENGEYAEPTPEMIEAYRKAEEELKRHIGEWLGKYLPDQQIPIGEKTRELLNKGLDYFYKLFNARQLLVHAIIVKLIREAYERIKEESGDPEYAKAVVTYLALAHGKLLDYNSVLTQWNPKGSIRNTFDRHDFQVGQDFGEGDMLTPGSGLDWVLFSNTGVVKAVRRLVELLSEARSRGVSVRVVLGDAADPSTYGDFGMFDLVVTDPPYYGNVNYAELSDYFYVWYRLSIGDLYPEAFKTELVPKEGEIVVNKVRRCDERCFEERMKSVFENIRYVLKDDGLFVLIYGHRSFEGLRAMFRAAFDAGFTATALWSFASEQPHSLHIMGKAAIRSNMVVVMRPRLRGDGCVIKPGFAEEVIEEASRAFAEVYGKLGLSLVDALMAANSAAFKVISKCWPLYTPEGQAYPLEKLENLVNKAVAVAFTRNVLGGDVDSWSVAYLIARGVYGEPAYDDLRRLGAGLGINHDEFIKLYCGEERQYKGEELYSVLPLTQIRSGSRGRLVDALAAALRDARSNVDAAVKRLEEFGYRLDRVVCRYIEELRQIAENEERELLGALAAKCGDSARPRPSATIDAFF